MGLVKVVHDAAKKGELQVYNPGEIGETFKETISTQDVQNIGVRNDTISRINIETGLEERVATFNDFDPSTVTKLRLKEDWFFDKERSVLDVRVLGIAPVVYKKNSTGQIEGMRELFWLYFPQCRFAFNNYFVYNPKNDAQWMSFDDLFWKRQFASTIYKQSNVFDRKIETYRAGVDALMESDKITEEIRTLEHDVWHF
jgi:gliding motility associated protien GldN